MATTYPVDILNPDGTEIEQQGILNFTNANNAPVPSASGIAAPVAVAPTGLTGAVSATRYVGGTASIAPTTGTFAVGDFVVTLTGRIFVCTVAGTPGTWIEPASILFAPLASPTFTGTVVVPAAAATTSAPRINQLTSALTVTSGTLPNTGAWVSGTAKVNPVTRQITVNVEVTTDGTNNAGTCAIAISPDDSTYTTVGTVAVPAAINNLGVGVHVVPVTLPAGWFIKLTFTATRITVAASIYY
jgi:hypothetical protein